MCFFKFSGKFLLEVFEFLGGGKEGGLMVKKGKGVI